MCKRKRMTMPTVNVEGNESVPEPNIEPREAVNVEGNKGVSEPNNEPREAMNEVHGAHLPEPGQEDREAVNEVHGAYSDDSFQAAICNGDEELKRLGNAIRRF
ncbi:uncharacterized protein A4U43_C03F29660 [Asparagus officinalis]|uniref:Uncharacterized protein n=1 Tax=Asparagus officinalis TaxID=4686 RepID=A0A5P1FGP4_ASPOF|nr:uncharacterized protein A4U43_C03F29660 [Asparagus officinalis]